jgi:hypothetical protein
MLRARSIVGLWLACGWPLMSAAQPATDAPARAAAPDASPLAGLSLAQAIGALQRAGLTVFYNSSVVRPGMRVDAEPERGDPGAQLASILEPHGLVTRPGPRGSLLIVRAAVERPAPPSPIAVAAPAPVLPLPAPQPPEIEEIIVAASQYALTREVAAVVTVTAADLEHLPDLGDDALRAVQRLPGAAANGFSARTHVRGGEAGETLVRFDELRLYDPFHLESFQGIFSTIDPRVVSAMEVHTGAFPAMFGDRLSGVVDVSSLAPPDRRYHEVSASFFNASALSSGLLANGGEWVVSVRRSNLDLLYGTFSDRPERPRYVDAFAKLSYQLTDSLRLTGSTLYFRDDVTLNDDLDVEEQASSNDEDRYTWLRFDHALGNLAGTTLLARARFDSRRSGFTAQPGVSLGELRDDRRFGIDSLQSDWSWRGGERLLVQLGGLLSRSRGRYDYADDVAFDVLFDAPGAPVDAMRSRVALLDRSARQQAAYANVRVSPTPRVTADLGVRWERQNTTAAATADVGPRLGLRYQLAARTFVRVGWGRFFQSQAINELAVADGELVFRPPQRADHAIVGVEHRFEGGATLRVEAYAKDLRNPLPRYENVIHGLTLLPELKPDRVRIAPAAASADGVEIVVTSRDAAPLSWWVGYSWSRAEDRIAGGDVPRAWDQTHAVSAGVSHDSTKWNVSGAVTHRSGWPATAIAFDLSGAVPRIVAGPRNAERHSDYRSADLRVTRKFVLDESVLSVFLEVGNVFNRRNRCCTEFQVEPDASGTPVLDLSRVDYLRLVPSLGFVWSF